MSILFVQPILNKTWRNQVSNKDETESISSEENYHFILPTEIELEKNKSLKSNKKNYRKYQSTQPQQKFPQLIQIDQEALRMKQVDIEQIYSQTEKDQNGYLVEIFFDKNRKLKRHADGVNLIKKFVSPIYKSIKLRNLSKDQQLIKFNAVQRSYEASPDFQQQIAKKSFQGVLPNITNYATRQVRVNTNHVAKINQSPQKQQLNIQKINVQSTNLMEKQDENQQQFLFGKQNEIYQSDFLKDIEESANLQNQNLQSPRLYEKDYTRISVIKHNQTLLNNQERRFKNYQAYQKDSLNNTFTSFNSQKLLNQEPIRLIAPFIDNHLKKLNENEDVIKLHAVEKKSMEQKKTIFVKKWNEFNESTNNLSTFLNNKVKDKVSPFKLLSLRKQFE